MFLGFWRFCIFAVALIAIASCKSVVERPLVGSAKPANILAISDKWIAIDAKETITLEIKRQENDSWYDFSFTENDKRIAGEFRVRYFDDKRIFNVNVTSLNSEGIKIFDLPEQKFLLLRAHFLDSNLVIVATKMDVFEAEFADHFDGEPRKLTDRCATPEGEDSSKAVPCSILLSPSKVISLTETPAFYRAFLNNYDDVFPMEDVLVLKPNS